MLAATAKCHHETVGRRGAQVRETKRQPMGSAEMEATWYLHGLRKFMKAPPQKKTTEDILIKRLVSIE